MIKLSNKSLLAIAVVLSLITALLLYNYLKGVSNKQAGQEGATVVVAKTDIAPKTKITPEMVQEVKVPPEYIQPGAVQSLDKVIGIVVREHIVNGEQISERRLVREGRAVGFTGVIPRDKRAVTVAVNEVAGVAGFVKAGDYVDVVVTFDANMVGDHVSQVVLQNILVLAANRDMENSPAEPAPMAKDNGKEPLKAGTVTLAVTPDEAAGLTLAEDRGKIRLALRPYLPANSIVISSPITPKDLVGVHSSPLKNEQQPVQPVQMDRQEAAPSKPQIVPENRGIPVIRGTKVESASVK